MSRVRDYLLRYADRPMVRPLALVGPVLVLLVALPLLRPLRHPAPHQVSDDEALRLATIRALVEHRSLHLPSGYKSIDGTIQTAHGVYSAQPPMMSLLLSVPAWVMTRMGLSFEDNELLIAYLLTLLGVTLPVAGAAGLIYRMGRLFELRRPLRALLGIAVVFGSGLISYAVVLNPHAPAAVLVLGSAGCLIHVAAMNRDDRRAGWFALAGACAALACTIDPAAAVLLGLLVFVIPAMRIPLGRRLAGVMLYVIGAVPVIAMHAAWNIPVTGGILPHVPTPQPHVAADVVPVVSPALFDLDEEEMPPSPGAWQAVGANLRWLLRATIGPHGLFSHFPVMILGIIGIGAVMHRNWPGATKTMAAAAGLGAVIIVGLHWGARTNFTDAMFANRFFLVFCPLLLFWSGAWLRRSHKLSSWIGAGILAAFSVTVGIVGATNPTPPQGFDGYTLVDNASRLLRSDAAETVGALAGRDS